MSKLQENETHWKMHFDYEYIGSHNLKEGEEVIVTIKSVRDELVFKPSQNEEVKKLIVQFEEETDLKMILNVTNSKMLERLFKTPHINQWEGKRIQIYAADIEAFGHKMKALRIRDVLPKSDVDVTASLKIINSCKTLVALKAAYIKLPVEQKNHKDVLALTNKLKKKYAST